MNNMIEIDGITFDLDNVKSIFCKAINKVDNGKYRPGHRIEEIYGWFWTYLEKQYGNMKYSTVMKLENYFDCDGYIFGDIELV